MRQWYERLFATNPTRGKRTRVFSIFLGVSLLALTLATVVQADTTPTTYYACVLFNEDQAAMPIGAAFNVMVFNS